MKALQMMIETYKQNPGFGNAKQFQGEYDTATHKVQMLESEVKSLKPNMFTLHVNMF